MTRRTRNLLVVAACLGLVVVAPLAQADKAAGLSLYDDADRLGAAGKWTEACGKFEASEKEFPRPLTLLRLGDCYGRVGKTASAWATFRDTEVAARAAQRDPAFNSEQEKRREAEAVRRRGVVEKKLTRLKIVVSAPVAGLVVKKDGSELPSEAWGSAVAVDPGTIAFEASAPGYVTWSESRAVSGEGVTVEVQVPALKHKPATVASASPAPVVVPPSAPKPAPTSTTGTRTPTSSPASTPSTDHDESSGSIRRTIGLTVGGIGVVTGIVGGIVAISAAHTRGTYTSCSTSLGYCTDTSQIQPYNDANSHVKTGWLVMGVGAAVAITGIVIFTTAPSTSGDRGTVSVGTTGTGFFLRGAF